MLEFMNAGKLVQWTLVTCFWSLVILYFIWQRRLSRRDAREGKALEERLLRPDWEFYERHLGRRAPAALRELFADRDLVTTCGLNYTKSSGISAFNPLDEDSLVDTAGDLGCDIVPLAVSGCGDPIYLRPGASESDTVYITYHDDPKSVKVFAESVAGMLKRLRETNQARKRNRT
jgi:hypothetical protein